MSKDNPADIVSRGLSPKQLLDSMWWHGPDWLTRTEEVHFTAEQQPTAEIPETKRSVMTFAVTANRFELFEKYSSLTRLINVVAYCFRFVHNIREKQNPRTGALALDERDRALRYLVRRAQQECFSGELNDLRVRGECHRSSKLYPLRAFLDENQIIRVGGRLEKSEVAYSQKHPMVLPAKHKLTELIVRHEHYRLLHAGPQLLLATIRTVYWPIAGRNAIRRVFRHCIVCFRSKPRSYEQLMGGLPGNRVTVARPFIRCRVDYAGPFSIRIGRNKTDKAYLCLFVCFVTKAVHLEVAVNLSSVAFLNAFRRFIARRGIPTDVYSDNGTNFQGACTEIKKIKDLVTSKEYQEEINRYSLIHSIHWHFTPLYTPHFGGLWEAGVKSVKGHLRKIMGDRCLTYEELTTVFASVESCLNSRPLCPLSEDPSDLEALTPGHFLIGEPLVALPEQDVRDVTVGRLMRYQLLSQIKQHFWTRWSQEYLNHLQQRGKWRGEKSNAAVGSVVLIKEPNAPPMRWHFGRIVKLHTGTDGLIRVVDVKTRKGIVTRAINNLCPLPLDEKQE